MSNYEFWDELGKIFNAVVAYQEKSIEFNNHFISPWLQLGKVFDKQGQTKEAILVCQKAIEINPHDAQNWFELGNIYFQMDSYDNAAEAYNKAIEISPDFGPAFNNLAFTLVSQGKYAEAIPLYQKSINLLKEGKEKAVAWNRLGNVYRKLNEYELAVKAFQEADKLDLENAGSSDELDNVLDSSIQVEENTDQTILEASASVKITQPDNVTSTEVPSTILDSNSKVTLEETSQDFPDLLPDVFVESDAHLKLLEEALETTNENAFVADTKSEQGLDSKVSKDPSSESQFDAINAQSSIETSVDFPAISFPVPDTSNITLTTTKREDEPVSQAEEVKVPGTEQDPDIAQSELSLLTIEKESEKEINNEVVTEFRFSNKVNGRETEEEDDKDDRQSNDISSSENIAYEEFLIDNNEPLNIFVRESAEKNAESQVPVTSEEPVTKIASTGEIEIESETQNAHFWNDLGNTNFNAGALDDAIIAYSKAIELDRWFAWPYSNLALAYVKKGRFAEAMLLYQHSIELFSSDNDKAISWNRLGDLYRHLNDYENAIAAYQRADELDPDNISLSQQSHFSLLGNYNMEKMPSYVS